MSFFPLRIYQNRCRLGLCPRPYWGAYSAPQTPSWFQGGSFVAVGNGREGREGLGRGGRWEVGERRNGEWKGKGEVGEEE